MIETKCDLCGKVVSRGKNQLNIKDEDLAVSFGISVTISKSGIEGYFNGDYYLLVCNECLDASLFKEPDKFNKEDLFLRALHNFDLFSNANIEKAGYALHKRDGSKQELIMNVADFIDGMHPDAIKLAMQVRERMSKLSTEAQKKILTKIDKQMLEELDKMEEGENDK